MKQKMGELLQSLSELERNVLVLRFGLEDGRQRSLVEVGQELGMAR
jgi:RNA polymerase primary sigma factor